jgi:hypothetical protein
MDYDEEAVLTKYIWDNYSNRFTQLERMGTKAIVVEEKAQHSDVHMAEMLRRRWGNTEAPQVVAALSEGVDAFRRWVRDRVLRDGGDSIHINRCPKCARIVRAPAAQQCLWCGHDWH